MGYPKLKLCILKGNYAICRLFCKERIPEWAANENESIVSVTSSEKELTIVCEQRLAPDDCEKSMDWKCIKIVGKFETPDMMKKFASKLKKVFTENIEDAPLKPFAELEKAEDEIERNIEHFIKRGKDKQKRRYQSIETSEKLTYSGKCYKI